MSQKEICLEYIEEFDSYGIEKETIARLSQGGDVAKITLPQEDKRKYANDAPTIGFLLGQDKSESGEEYYTISKSYLQALSNTGARLRFLDYENPDKQMNACDGAVLPGGAFNNPETFYIDGKVNGDEIGKRYFAYQKVIEAAHKKHKPMLGICAGAQMIGALLGNMKMYRNIKDEVVHPAVHKPKTENDVRMHQIKLLRGTPIFDIMGIEPTENKVMINSRHNQAMVHGALQDYVSGNPKVKMHIYAICDSDGIPEMWGNEEAGILCVQGHPEDLVVPDLKKQNDVMLNLYNYVADKAKEYKKEQMLKIGVNTRNTCRYK